MLADKARIVKLVSSVSRHAFWLFSGFLSFSGGFPGHWPLDSSFWCNP
jgi:hypothetical protein